MQRRGEENEKKVGGELRVESGEGPNGPIDQNRTKDSREGIRKNKKANQVL